MLPSNPEVKDFDPDQRPHRYRQQLNCWAIARLFPEAPKVIVARFRSRSDADGHLKLLQQRIPEGQFEVFFDRQSESKPT